MTNRIDTRSAQEIIKTALRKADLSETWLAEKLHIKVGTLNSRLNTAKTFPHAWYVDIMEIFKKYEIIGGDAERCKAVIETINEWNGVLGGTISLMSKTVQDTVLDNEMDPEDRRTLLAAIRESRDRINQKFDKMERLVEE